MTALSGAMRKAPSGQATSEVKVATFTAPDGDHFEVRLDRGGEQDRLSA